MLSERSLTRGLNIAGFRFREACRGITFIESASSMVGPWGLRKRAKRCFESRVLERWGWVQDSVTGLSAYLYTLKMVTMAVLCPVYFGYKESLRSAESLNLARARGCGGSPTCWL